MTARSATGRVAFAYDILTRPFERRLFARWRRRFWRAVPRGGLGLEVGVGTGANFPSHPDRGRVVGVDVSEAMVRRAQRKPGAAAVPLVVADVQRLPFRSATFDWVGETLVFCEVRSPRIGLGELRRVLKPDSPLLLLEHVRPRGWLGRLADGLTTLTGRLWGEHFDRDPDSYAAVPGLVEEGREWLWGDAVVFLRMRRDGTGMQAVPADGTGDRTGDT